MVKEGLYDRGYVIEFKEGDKAFYRTPLQYYTLVSDQYHVVADGDSLLSIAQKYYTSQAPWYVIADVNASLIEDIFSLVVGTTLLIPDLNLINTVYGQS
jgi:nucleoid-associated protein YgaU